MQLTLDLHGVVIVLVIVLVLDLVPVVVVVAAAAVVAAVVGVDIASVTLLSLRLPLCLLVSPLAGKSILCFSGFASLSTSATDLSLEYLLKMLILKDPTTCHCRDVNVPTHSLLLKCSHIGFYMLHLHHPAFVTPLKSTALQSPPKRLSPQQAPKPVAKFTMAKA